MRVRDALGMLAKSGLETAGPMKWADLGCGDGTFTRALAELLAPGSVIHAMDVDGTALRRLAQAQLQHQAQLQQQAQPRPHAPQQQLQQRIQTQSQRQVLPPQTQAQDADVRIETHVGDFTKQPWPFGPLDGILMANSLHYVRDQTSFVRACASQMTARRRFLMVEYDTDSANPWVPYPLSRARLAAVFSAAGYSSVTVLGTRTSVYRRANMYAALIEP